MKKLITILFVFVSLSSISFSQTIFIHFGTGFGIGNFGFNDYDIFGYNIYGSGEFNKLETPGYGGSLTYNQMLSKSFSFYFTSGIYSFSESLTDKSTEIIPLSVGFRYNFGAGGFLPYLGLEGGYNLVYTSGLDYKDWGIAPSIGLTVPITRKMYWDIFARYNLLFSLIHTNSYVGIYTGLGFGF